MLKTEHVWSRLWSLMVPSDPEERTGKGRLSLDRRATGQGLSYCILEGLPASCLRPDMWSWYDVKIHVRGARIWLRGG